MQLPKTNWKKQKHKRLKKKPVGYKKESTLQGLLDNYLQYKPHLGCIRIPDELFKLIYGPFLSSILISIVNGHKVSQDTAKLCLGQLGRLKTVLSDHLLGVPDNNYLIPIGDKYNLSLCHELKSKTGDQRQGQKNWAKKCNVTVQRVFESVVDDIEEFEKYAEYLNNQMKGE